MSQKMTPGPPIDTATATPAIFPRPTVPDSAVASSTEHRKWEEIKKSQQESAGDHEQFFKDLEESNDGFEQVAGYFGRGRLR